MYKPKSNELSSSLLHILTAHGTQQSSTIILVQIFHDSHEGQQIGETELVKQKISFSHHYPPFVVNHNIQHYTNYSFPFFDKEPRLS